MSDGITEMKREAAVLKNLDEDVGRQGHYTCHKIQPIEYIIANGLGFCEGNVVKYITRYKYKNGIQDLKKARQYIDFLISEMEEESGI